MNNKKRAIMVPVMTLAVCAIAMVGLGFALTSSVVTDSNVVGKLMVDLNDDGNFGSATEPTTGKIDNLLQFGVTSYKTKNEQGNYVVTKKLSSNVAYMKIYGNVSNITLDVSTTGMSETGVKSLEIEIKKQGEDSTFATANVSNNNGIYTGTFSKGSSSDIFISGAIYSIQIVKVNGKAINTELSEEEANSFSSLVGTNLAFTFNANSDKDTA